MCPEPIFFKHFNISLEIFANMFQLIKHVNTNFKISFEIYVNKLQLIQNINISFELCANGSKNHLKYA